MVSDDAGFILGFRFDQFDGSRGSGLFDYENYHDTFNNQICGDIDFINELRGCVIDQTAMHYFDTFHVEYFDGETWITTPRFEFNRHYSFFEKMIDTLIAI